MADSYTVDFTPHEGTGTFAPMPAGSHHVVCVDGVFLGEKVDSYQGGPPKIVKKYAFVFQSEEINPDTQKPYEISKEFTISMNEKAALRKFLSAWRGKTYTDEEAKGVDLARVLGANGIASVEHAVSAAGRTYGKLLSIGPIMRTMQKIAAAEYTRGAYWETRKAEYAAGVEAHRASLAAAAQQIATARPVPPRVVPPVQPLATGYVDRGHDEDLLGAAGYTPPRARTSMDPQMDEVPF